MQVLGRLAADPELKTTKNGKDYVRYTVATSDPPTGPAEDGERAPTTTSYHRFYVFGDRGVDRMKNIKKGYRVLVDAEFRIERTPAEQLATQRISVPNSVKLALAARWRLLPVGGRR